MESRKPGVRLLGTQAGLQERARGLAAPVPGCAPPEGALELGLRVRARSAEAPRVGKRCNPVSARVSSWESGREAAASESAQGSWVRAF